MNDLSTIQPVARKIAITHPASGDETGLVLHLQSMSSPEVKAVQRRTMEQALKQGRRKVDLEKAEQNRIELLATAVIGWDWNGDASWGGEKLTFTKANVRKVLGASWLRDQIDAELGDEAAFFRGDD